MTGKGSYLARHSKKLAWEDVAAFWRKASNLLPQTPLSLDLFLGAGGLLASAKAPDTTPEGPHGHGSGVVPAGPRPT